MKLQRVRVKDVYQRCLTKRIMTDYVELAMIFYAQSTFVPTLLVYPGFS